MKSLFFSILLSAMVLFSACAGTPVAEPHPLEPTIQSFRFTSIEGMKNGKPFINYLGEKLEGC